MGYKQYNPQKQAIYNSMKQRILISIVAVKKTARMDVPKFNTDFYEEGIAFKTYVGPQEYNAMSFDE